MHARSLTVAAILAFTLAAHPAQAQQVSAHVVLHDGPVAGGVVFGAPSYSPAQRVLYAGPGPRVIVVERFSHPRRPGYWQRHGYHRVTIYYEPRSRRYFDRLDQPHRHWRAVGVYERGGRYYRDDD